jgi:hypothetical protein
MFASGSDGTIRRVIVELERLVAHAEMVLSPVARALRPA